MTTTTSTTPMAPAQESEMVPRRAIIGIGLTLAGVLAGVAAVRLGGHGPQRQDAAALSTRLLRFEDLPDGGILVVDDASGTALATMHGEQGFLRGVLRSLMRERRRRELDLKAPLALIARADGRLTLHDPSTGQRIDLESFGPSNFAVFAPWVAAPAADPRFPGAPTR